MKTYTVSLENGDFKTLNEAAAALKGGSEETILKVSPGEYNESVVFECSNLTIDGEDSSLVTIFDGNYARMKDAEGNEIGTFNTAVVRIDGNNNVLRNLTIINRAGIGFDIGQAVALYADGDTFICDNCVLIAHQDTLFTAPLPPLNKHGRNEGFGPKQEMPRTPSLQCYSNCYIEGDIDFIFGGATVLFSDCTIFSHDSIAERRRRKMIASFDNDFINISSDLCRGYVCAPSTAEDAEFGYLFYRCHFTSDCPKGTVYLGRPWRPYGKAAFLFCTIGEHINPSLFNDWDDKKNRETSSFVLGGCTRINGSPVDSYDENGFGQFISDDEAETYIRKFENFAESRHRL